MHCLKLGFSLCLIFACCKCFAGFSGYLDISTYMVSSIGQWELPTFLSHENACNKEVTVRPGDVADLREKLTSTPAGCAVRLSGAYELDFPLYINHRLRGPVDNNPDGDWFIPLSFIPVVTDTGTEATPEPQGLYSEALYYPGLMTAPPKALIKPAPGYLFSSLLFLGENASLEHLGLDNRALPLENGCQKVGIYLTHLDTVDLSHIALSTVSGLCYPLQSGETQAGSGFSHSSGSATSTESVQSGSGGSKPPSPLSTYGSGSNDDDDNKDNPWRRRKVLMKAHYVDIDDFEGDWGAYSHYQQSCPTVRRVQLYADDQIARTRTYQKVGTVLTITGFATMGLLLRGSKARGGWLNLPWPNYAHIAENRINHVIQPSWIYLLGLPFGLISQAWNFSLISIPRRQYLRELKRKTKEEN